MQYLDVTWNLFLFFRKISLPFCTLGNLFQQLHPSPQQLGNMRHHHMSCHHLPRPPERQRKPQLVHQQRMPVDLGKAMVMLESLEPSSHHRVLKEVWPFIACNQALMHMRQSEQPPAPFNSISLHHEPSRFSRSALDRTHLQHLPHQLKAGRQQKAPLDWGMDMNAVANRKQ